MLTRSDRFAILSFILAVAFFDYAILSGPSHSYELSIYQSMGGIFWGIGIGAILCATLSIVVKETPIVGKRHYWLLILTLLLLSVTISILPCLRGYVAVDRHDELTHIGILRSMVVHSQLWSEDFYPALHLLSHNLNLVSSLQCLNAHMMVMPIFVIVLLVSVHSIAKHCFTKLSSLWSLVLVAAPVLLMTPRYFTPTDASFAFIPLVLLVQLRLSDAIRMRLQWYVVFMILLASAVFYHPQLCATLPFAMFLIPIARKLTSTRDGELHVSKFIVRNDVGIAAFSTAFLWIVFVLWMRSFPLFDNSLVGVYRILTGSIEESGSLAFYSSVFEQARLSTFELATFFVGAYGSHVMLLAAVLFLSLPTVRRYWASRGSWFVLYLGLVVIVFLVLSVSSFLGNLIMPFGRVFVFVLIGSLLMTSMGISSILTEAGRRPWPRRRLVLLRIVTCCLVVTLASMSLGGFFHSPRIGSYNSEVAISTYEGHLWLITEKDEEVVVMEVLGMFGRYVDLSLGPRDGRQRQDALFYEASTVPPTHFGYDDSLLLGNSLLSNRYLAYDLAATEYYTHVFPTQGSYFQEDFVKLQNDVSVDRILDNGGFFCYCVFSSG